MSDRTARPGAGVDHLVFAVPDLTSGCDAIERLLGVRPAAGGRHPAWGTHNALLALGPETYLEVIAPDPDLAPPPRGVLFGADTLAEPRLVTWALRTEAIEAMAATAGEAGVGIGPIECGSRRMPDGDVLSWRLTDPYAMPLDGAIPFLIDWGDTRHPATVAPAGGDLREIRLAHPKPAQVRSALAALGIGVDVRAAPRFGLFATIRTSKGTIELT